MSLISELAIFPRSAIVDCSSSRCDVARRPWAASPPLAASGLPPRVAPPRFATSFSAGPSCGAQAFPYRPKMVLCSISRWCWEGNMGFSLRSPPSRSHRQKFAIAVRCASLAVLACRWLAVGGSHKFGQRSGPCPILSLQDGRLKELTDKTNVSLTFNRKEPSQYGSNFVKLARSELACQG